MHQHKMTHLAVQGIGVNSDQFRDSMDHHLAAMSRSGWELVSTTVTEQFSQFRGTTSADALLFWKRPDQAGGGEATVTAD